MIEASLCTDQANALEGPSLLTIRELTSGYGNKQVLDRVHFSIAAGELLAVIGHNGAGKSTLLKVLFGLLPLWRGSIEWAGRGIATPSPRHMLRHGMVYFPQGGRLFPRLTGVENLRALCEYTQGGSLGDSRLVRRASELFPELEPLMNRRAGTWSGGERQMLVLAAAFLGSPRLLLLDEPSLGLSPVLIRSLFPRIAALRREFRTAVILVEQRIKDAIQIADRVCVLGSGRVRHIGPAAELCDVEQLRRAYL